MPKPKIDRVKLSQLLKQGKTQREVAQVFGVSEGAISKAKKELNISVVKSVALESAHKVVDKNLDAIDQLQRVNQVANQLLDELTGEDQVIDRMVKAVEVSLEYEGDPISQKKYIRQVILRVNQDKNTALKACAEIRGQLNLQLDIFKTLYDMQAVAEFQKEVLTAIGEEAPDVRNRIIQRLKESRSLRQSISIN
jgi:uncharacterized protein YerC